MSILKFLEISLYDTFKYINWEVLYTKINTLKCEFIS